MIIWRRVKEETDEACNGKAGIHGKRRWPGVPRLIVAKTKGKEEENNPCKNEFSRKAHDRLLFIDEIEVPSFQKIASLAEKRAFLGENS
jgi:hypothetical protein